MYVIGKTTVIRPRYLSLLVWPFLDAFVHDAAGRQFRTVLPAVAEWRKRDENVTAAEQANLDRLLARVRLEG